MMAVPPELPHVRAQIGAEINGKPCALRTNAKLRSNS